jgi:hypothetical protein
MNYSTEKEKRKHDIEREGATSMQGHSGRPGIAGIGAALGARRGSGGSGATGHVNFNPTETTDISVNDSAHITCSLFSPILLMFLSHYMATLHSS